MENNMDDTSAPPAPTTDSKPASPPWTYPNRLCRICLEEVPPTVTFYPPGVPERFQRAVVEYKSEDEGRLVKPCHCRGSLRYIHEQCLTRLRTESARPGSMWKCHQCGYSFNFNRLNIQKILSSRIASAVLTIFVMVIIMFFLGFIANPIINLYEDPYYTVMYGEFWDDVVVVDDNGLVSAWSAHFLKGLVSMGFIGFAKVIVLQPWHWWNLRNTGLMGGRGRPSSTGRDRVNQVQWIAVIIGVASAFYFFYQWVQTLIGRSLTRIGNSIVDTHLPNDDEDLMPPPGWSATATYAKKPETPTDVEFPPHADNLSNGHLDTSVKDDVTPEDTDSVKPSTKSLPEAIDDREEASNVFTKVQPESAQTGGNSHESIPTSMDHANTIISNKGDGSVYSSALDSAQQQSWNWSDIGT